MLLLYSNPYSCCYGPSAPGEVKAAGAHLCQVFGQEPRDAVAQARVGVVEAWQQNYRSAARRLSKLTEKDSSSLDFLLALIPFNQRKHMAQVGLLTEILDSVQNEQLCSSCCCISYYTIISKLVSSFIAYIFITGLKNVLTSLLV